MSKEIKISFKDYLSEVFDKPAKLHKAYSLFRRYSFLNSILAASQLEVLEPINTYQGWLKLGRQVKKGSKAISLMMPVRYKIKKGIESEKVKEGEVGDMEENSFTGFIKKPFWFSLSQTEGEEFTPEELPNFKIEAVLASLGITQQKFAITNGNCQGYALPDQKIIAINPLAFAPYKTSIHEIAHCLLHGEEKEILDGQELNSSIKEFEAETTAYLVCSSLGKFEHLEYSRGYIRNWIKRQDIEEKNFRRAFDAANKILKAGLTEGEGK